MKSLLIKKGDYIKGQSVVFAGQNIGNYTTRERRKKMKQQITNENYITIQGFMVNELNLKGNELLIYAIIYGFSQLDNQEFKGSLQYLADWTNSTKQGVIKNLKSLRPFR